MVTPVEISTLLEVQDNCPLCSGSRIRRYRRIGQWWLYRCSDCTVAFLNPLPQNPNHYYDSRKYFESDHHIIFKNAAIQSKRFYPAIRLIHSYLSPAKTTIRFLEIGPGNGAFSLAAREQGWQVSCLDVSPIVREELTAQNLNVSLYNGLQVELEPDRFDIVALNHVIEHLRNPLRTLEGISDSLVIGGLLYLVFPNYRSLDQLFHGDLWSGWDLPYHLFQFNRKAISRLLSNLGFEIVYTDNTFFNPITHLRRAAHAMTLRDDIRHDDLHSPKKPEKTGGIRAKSPAGPRTPAWRRMIKRILSERNMVVIARKQV